MKYVLSLAVLCSFAFSQQQQSAKKPARCGLERWAIKTLADKEASKVFSLPQEFTIEQLRQYPAPTDLKSRPDHRHMPVEFTRYRVRALLLGFKPESDLDIHMVIASPADKSITMIAEIPAGKCVPLSMRTNEMQLQAWVLKTFKPPKNRMMLGRMIWLPTPPRVIVTGIGFFDFLHGQDGVAPNGVEIHPVVDIFLSK